MLCVPSSCRPNNTLLRPKETPKQGWFGGRPMRVILGISLIVLVVIVVLIAILVAIARIVIPKRCLHQALCKDPGHSITSITTRRFSNISLRLYSKFASNITTPLPPLPAFWSQPFRRKSHSPRQRSSMARTRFRSSWMVSSWPSCE